MSFSNYSNTRFKRFELDSDLDLIVLGFVTHGDKTKTLRQLYFLKARHIKFPDNVSRIDSVINRFQKANSFKLF
jgi:5'-3' exonuclease